MTADPLNKIGMTGGTAVVPGAPATYITLPSTTLWLPLERAAAPRRVWGARGMAFAAAGVTESHAVSSPSVEGAA